MENNVEKIFNEYNDFSKTGAYIQSNETALKILKEGFKNSEELKKKIREYDNMDLQNKLNHDYQELKSIIEFNQPRSEVLTILYINLVLNSIDDNFFNIIDIDRDVFFQIILSITFYVLFLQSHKNLDKPLSKSAKKNIFKRENYLLGIDELKKVCWSLKDDDFKKFTSIFAFDYMHKDTKELKDEKVFKHDESIFILSIEEFVEYILFQVEAIYRTSCTKPEFSKYQNRKGLEFEKMVYSFSNVLFNEIAHSVNYYPSHDKISETDLIIQDENSLIIVECKSGTLNLSNSSNDNEIKQKINNKVKKAYKTLENAYKYVTSNVEYNFSNKSSVIKGYSNDIEPLCLHLSMYPIDSLSSNIHTLDENYIGDNDNPKITMSFEHYLAISLEHTLNDSLSITQYLKKRKEHILMHSKIQFDINELDLYYQIANKQKKSMLSESLESGLLETFPDDINIITTFQDSNGREFRPAQDIIKNLDGNLLSILLESKFGLNKKYLNYLKKYLSNEIQ
ncbi:hypothetical protein ABZ134_002860 [Listeria monocytogenes]|uniref:hypothetical protein n=1 Tax=Listeria welshimeri TaxID=1643 RepID=UPI0018876CAA|nr:hypothetical protein [Listeria welshimeri]EHZ7795102.1 hypothetical protein [Listeria monocytogenes]EHZ7802622.1 hypothetical protein [Listeria monocytogenes]EHZ7811325.1 hypothetical protein [Listeria monocytogenes]EJH4993799.1 hypothetical protein [Listeria monocytogenes]EJH5102401.1 hypothetical protein [Listeria monocytogenes]